MISVLIGTEDISLKITGSYGTILTKEGAFMSGNEKKPEILLVLTGGTICSSVNKEGHRYSNAEEVKIVEAFRNSSSPFRDAVGFQKKIPLDVLSENMTVERWNDLLNMLKTVEEDRFKGIIILHGTDTLAYTSSLLAITLAGMKIPVCLVSSQLPLDHTATNGHANFRASVELIMNGIAPNVYAVYRNSDNVIYAHYGAHLQQCANYSDDFYSNDAMAIPNPANASLEGIAFETGCRYVERISPLSSCVLRLMPYVGLDYSRLDLNGIRAVVHGTYHSQSVCVQRGKGMGDYDEASILHLLDVCNRARIPVFLAPCSPEAFRYESTGDALGHGAAYIYGMTNEMAYVKTLIGAALGLRGKELQTFLNTSINHEITWPVG